MASPSSAYCTSAWTPRASCEGAQSANVTWGIGETGAAGPKGTPYGHAAGHDVVAVSGPVQVARTIATGSSDRQANMVAFAVAALEFLNEFLHEKYCRPQIEINLNK
jgi:nicotinamide mononucleotide (NMN) deamidase PncC